MGWDDLVTAARRGEGPLKHARAVRQALIGLRLPVFRPLAALLYAERDLRARLWPLIAQFFYREPILRYRAEQVGHHLTIEGPLPWITGSGRIRIGNHVTIGGKNAWIVGFKVSTGAEFVIGDRVYLGYQNAFSVAKGVRVGAGTMLATRVQVYDNISHPLSPERRRRHESFTLDEASPVTIGENCWIGHSAMIMRGVTIGDNSVVGAASIVTKDVPPNCLAAGTPARVIRSLD